MSFAPPFGLRDTMPRPRKIFCDLGALAPDAAAVDALARLRLAAKRNGVELSLVNVSCELQELLTFLGLLEVLRVEVAGQPEEREQRVGLEEERELGDAAR
jgi:anti-anti-sigma regulatory factor